MLRIHSYPCPRVLSSISMMVFAVFAVALLTFSPGCDSNAVPEKIAIAPQEAGIESLGCDGEPDGECEPVVIGMCNLVNTRPSLKLGKLVDYDYVEDGVPCEDRKYRLSYAVATFQVIDPIAGKDMGSQLELINFGNHGGREPGSYYLFHPWERDGKSFLGQSRKVMIDDDAAAFGESSAEMAGVEVVYDIPTNYAAFADEAVEHWYNFDEMCPEWEIHEYGTVTTDEQFEAWLYEKNCPDPDAEYNQ